MTIKIACYIILFIYLFLMSIYDIRKKEIQIEISVVTIVVLAAGQICRIACGEQIWYLAFTGVIEGGLLIGLSKITKGQVGIGDGIVFITSGVMFGFFENGILLFLSLVFAAVAGGFLLLLRRVGRKDMIPFVPFIFVGYGVMCLWKILS